MTPLRLRQSNIRIKFCQQPSSEVVRDIKQLLMSSLWGRNWCGHRADEIFQWRYGDLPGTETLLAYDAERLVAMIASYLRPYFINGKLTYVREPADWFCLPEYRPLNIGVRLMYMLMDEQEPILSIGGNDGARTLLTALGWQRLPDTTLYTLPLTTKFLASKALRLLHLPATLFQAGRLGEKSWPACPRLLLRRHQTPSWRHLDSATRSTEITSSANLPDVVPLMRERELQWLLRAPEDLGTFFCLEFPEKTGGTAFVLGRLYSYHDLNYGKLIHFQTSSPSVKAYRRILAETVQYLDDLNTDVVQCRASAAFLRQALKTSGFIRSGSNLVYCWGKNGNRLQGTHHLTFLRGDDAIRPYPE